MHAPPATTAKGRATMHILDNILPVPLTLYLAHWPATSKKHFHERLSTKYFTFSSSSNEKKSPHL